MLIPSVRADGQTMPRPRGWAPLQWTAWQKEAKSFDGIAAYAWTFSFLVLADGSESMEGMVVTKDYFRVLGLEPTRGRTFTDSECSSPPAPVIILGYDLWQRKFQGDPAIIGKQIRLSRRDTPLTVIGVMPAAVRFLPSPGVAQEPNYNVNSPVDYWLPGAPNPARLKDLGWDVVGRLARGASPRQGQEELRIITERQAQSEPDFQGFVPQLQSLKDEMNREGARILLPLLGAAILVLLIACGNAAALLLVRGLQRQQEYAVRSALGIGRLALFRLVSSESLLMATMGGALGVGLALAVVRIFKLIGRHAIPRLDAVSTGWPVLAGGLGFALIAALLAALVPAIRATRLDPVDVLKSAGPKTSASRGERRLLRGVTTAQTALTLALLVGAGLLTRTMMNLSKVQSGFNTGHILAISVTAVQGDWSQFHRRALEQVSSLPGVQGAAFAWGVPLTGNSWDGLVEIEDQPIATRDVDRIGLPLRSVTPGYFNLLGERLVDGRDFRDTDKNGAPNVAIVNQALVDRYFHGGNALGKKIWPGGRQRPASTIVGVIASSRTGDLAKAAEPEVYFCLWQWGAFSKHLVVRAIGEPRPLFGAIHRVLRSVDPTTAIENPKTLEEIRDDSLSSRTFATQLLVGFSVVGSVLTLVGIYGVLALSVAARRREIAIRAAVGAGRRDISKLVFGEGFRLIAGGVICGLAAAVVLSRVLRSFLYDVEPTDPVTLIGVGLLFAGVALMACLPPIRRAAKVDPLDALRYE
jgi:putative ABC transport system permease protein